MKPSARELAVGKNKPCYLRDTPGIVVITAITLVVLLPFIPLLYHPLPSSFSITWKSTPPPPSAPSSSKCLKRACDIFRGEWVPNPKAPYYTNLTCRVIHEHQNCMKHGRADTDFMRWRWKPDRCDLPAFNPAAFLDLVRGKSMAFLGDSVGRNHMQSLVCLLSEIASPKSSNGGPEGWIFPEYNFTVVYFWSPFLVKAVESDPNASKYTGLNNLYLDKADGNWMSEIEKFSYVIVSAGHWFFRPVIYYQGNDILGCHQCHNPNISDWSAYYGCGRAFRSTFRFLNDLPNYKGTTFLETFLPQHYENGQWNTGGDCKRTRPFRGNETRLEGSNLEMYMTQLKEFRPAKKEAARRGRKFELLDVTEAMLLRPDGHPSGYGRLRDVNSTNFNDCVHWCLPGPMDNINELLHEMLKRSERSTKSSSVMYG